MIISLNWLKKFTDIDMPVGELVTLIGARLVEIEEVIDLGAKYKDVLVAKVVEVNNIEGSDHLSLTKIDDGGVATDIKRDDKGLIQVVCGASNVRAGQLVAWFPPKAIVPSTYGKLDQLILDTRELRGVISNGMIASARELDLYDEHEGILELDNDVKPGMSFAKAYELNDYLFDIENKSLTHRPDCFGIVGFTREIAAITGKTFKTPRWLTNLSPDFNSVQNNEVELSVVIDDSELSPRYQAIVMSGADGNKKSPILIQTYLSRVGVRPINAVVDVTNYLMMLTGQPLHAFDYDKVVTIAGGKAEIHVRSGRKKETLELLDGRTINLSTDDVVITAGETAIGLAGAMGGANTEIDINTKNIIIECATFNLFNLRGTQMRHGIASEAITRFTKGQSAILTAPVLFDAVRLMSEWAGAKCVSNLVEVYPVHQKSETIEFSTETINNILGSQFKESEIINSLNNVEFVVSQTNPEIIKATAPYWRADIHIVEDIAEEVGRLNGFDNISPILPMRDFTAVKPSNFNDFRSQISKILVRSGANEVLTYSFIHDDILQKSGQDVKNSYALVNSISPNLQYYRQTLTPSLLDLIHPNIKQGQDKFALFEINKTHSKSDGLTDEGVPVEADMLALVVAYKDKLSGAPYYHAKRILDYLCDSLGIELIYKSITKELNDPESKPFEYRHSALVIDKISNTTFGIVGEYKKSVIKAFKLPEYVAGFEINVRTLFDAVQKLGPSYKPLSRYPATERDICFQVDREVQYSQIIDSTDNALKSIQLDSIVSPVDIYQPKDGKTKNITIRIRLSSHDHTLTSNEVNTVVDNLAAKVASENKATII